MLQTKKNSSGDNLSLGIQLIQGDMSIIMCVCVYQPAVSISSQIVTPWRQRA